MKKEYELSQMRSIKNPYVRMGMTHMQTQPKVFSPQEAPRELMDLAKIIVPKLLVGDHPAMAALREQFERASVSSVELTGHGFFINYEVPTDTLCANPADFEGGNAQIEVANISIPAGCILFVRDGRLAVFEGYTFCDDWPEHPEVLSIKEIHPLVPPQTQRG